MMAEQETADDARPADDPLAATLAPLTFNVVVRGVVAIKVKEEEAFEVELVAVLPPGAVAAMLAQAVGHKVAVTVGRPEGLQ